MKALQSFISNPKRSAGKEAHGLGYKLYQESKYQGAEEYLREAVQAREKVLGKGHKDTLASKYWLGRTLYKEDQYQEAEGLLQEVVQGQEKVLGEKDWQKDWYTLKPKYWLASTLYHEKKYQEAEELLQGVVQEQEKIAGANDRGTLGSKSRLAQTLYEQAKYREAEELYSEVVKGEAKVFGKEDSMTLHGKYWLARTLYAQQKYEGAEELYREAVQGQEEVLGKADPVTLQSKHWLALTLGQQQKYQEAEKLLGDVVQGREKVLGKDHRFTLDSRRRLQELLVTARPSASPNDTQTTLTNRLDAFVPEAKGADDTQTLTNPSGGFFPEAKEANDTQTALANGSGAFIPEAKGANDSQTTFTNRSGAFLPVAKGANDSQTTLANRLGAFFPEAKGSRTTYSDLEVYEISSLLKHLNLRWSKVPRTYIVLRTIGFLDLLDKFIDLGFSDYWFPVTLKSLPDSLSPKVCANFVAAQDLVLTKSMDLERSEEGRHRYFKRDEPLPFERKEILGSGGFGQVDRVLSLISFREYARKRVPRNTAFAGGGKEAIKCFVAEIEVLKRLKHRHVVEFVGSYTDPKFMGLIMSPVAEMDLSTYLKDANTAKHLELRTFFGCLARALEFLHGQNVRHKDIKPGNILVDHGNVLFTDFGLAFDFTEATRSTTLGMVNGMTPRYCAPEVAIHEPRNTSSDIWSLGVVFLEMLVVLKSETIKYMNMYFQNNGSKEPLIYKNPVALAGLIADLEGKGIESDNRALGWIKDMLQVDRQLRPTAASLVTSITAADANGERNTSFCGLCCFSPEDDVSDAPDELEDDDF